MLIIEGADCLGKTTLINQLQELISNDPRVHANVTKSHLGAEAKDWPKEKYIDGLRPWHIQDRWHISEQVYGTVFRSVSTLNADDIAEISQKVYNAGGLIGTLMCEEDAHYMHLLNTYHHTRNEMYDNFDKLGQVNRLFSHVAYQGNNMRLNVTVEHNKIMHLNSDVAKYLANAYICRQLSNTPQIPC